MPSLHIMFHNRTWPAAAKTAAAIACVAAALALTTFAAHAAGDFGLSETAGAAGLNKGSTVQQILGTVIKTAMGLVGTVFFLLMLYSGFLWMTARGAQETVKKAKEMMTGAIIGILIVTGAYSITDFIIKGVGGTSGGAETASSETAGAKCTVDDDCKGLEVCEEKVCVCREQDGCVAPTATVECVFGNYCESKEECGNGSCSLSTNTCSCPLIDDLCTPGRPCSDLSDCGSEAYACAEDRCICTPPAAPGACQDKACTRHSDCNLQGPSRLCYTGSCDSNVGGEDCNSVAGCPHGKCEYASGAGPGGPPPGASGQPTYTDCSPTRSCTTDGECGPGTCSGGTPTNKKCACVEDGWTVAQCIGFRTFETGGACYVGVDGNLTCSDRCDAFFQKYPSCVGKVGCVSGCKSFDASQNELPNGAPSQCSATTDTDP